jgi:EAL domain-containing protein (putative c-di-GMP-specific phosphodiesterase class I)/CheY-like chemotaxis protein
VFHDAGPAPTIPRLLIVDDEPIQRLIVAREAEKLRWLVDEAPSLAKAEMLLRSGRFDAVVLDLCLGTEDGLSLLHKLRDIAPDVVVIFISGAGKRVLAACSRVARSMGLRVAGTLRKPIQCASLAALLQSQPTSRAAAGLQLASPSLDQLERAFARGEVYAEFQPTIDLNSGRLLGMEALARWRSPRYGDVPPDLFIPVAEQSGLIADLTQEVLRQAGEACQECRLYQKDFSVAVNISPLLLSNERFPSTIDRTLAGCSLPHGALVAEITESSVAANPPLANEILTRLSIKGVRLSIDDFGTGHSSLSSLLRSPFTELKIDRSFVEVCPADNEAWKIVRGVLMLAHELGIRVVAEGIENQDISDRLTDAGCDIGQGWLFGRPVSKDGILSLVQSYASPAIEVGPEAVRLSSDMAAHAQ